MQGGEMIRSRRRRGDTRSLSEISFRLRLCSDGNQRSRRQGLRGVQSTLGLPEVCPTAGARIFARVDCAGAMRASQAGIIAVMQRVVRNVVLADVLPYCFGCPVGERVYFHQLEFRIPLNFLSVCAVRRLISANGGNPGFELGQLAAQGFDLPKIAALIRIPLPECGSVKSFLAFGCEGRVNCSGPHA